VIINGAYGTAVGTGLANTIAIVNQCPDTTTAAYRCLNYAVNGYDNWHLPSFNEFALIHQNLISQNLGNMQTEPIPTYGLLYWTSSQFDAGHGWHYYAVEPWLFAAFSKIYSIYVRPVRYVSESEITNYNATLIAWSTGETTPTIAVTPTQTTTYSVTVNQGNQSCTNEVTIEVAQPSFVSLEATIMEGETYAFNGQVLSEAGVYEAVLSTAAGCDSVVTLTLSTQPIISCSIESSVENLCEGESAALNVLQASAIPNQATLVVPENMLYSGTGQWNYSPGNDIIGNYSWSYGTPGMFIYGDSTQRYGSIEASVRLTWGGYNLAGIAMGVQRSNQGPHPFNGPNGGYFLALNGGSNLVLLQGNNNLYWMGYEAVVLASAGAPGIDLTAFQKLKLEVIPGGIIHGYLNDELLIAYQIPSGIPQEGRFALITANAAYEYSGLTSAYFSNYILWSTGETSPSITVSPSETTTYSVTVTQGDQTCTSDVTITVNQPSSSSLDVTIAQGETYTFLTRLHCNVQFNLLNNRFVREAPLIFLLYRRFLMLV